MKLEANADYYKVLGTNDTNHGYKYKIGENKLHDVFNHDRINHCGQGGLYICDADNISQFYSYGERVAVVRVDPEDPEFCSVCYDEKCRVNKLTITKNI